MNLTTRQMSDRDLIAQLTQLSNHSPKAALILTALTDDTWFEAVAAEGLAEGELIYPARESELLRDADVVARKHPTADNPSVRLKATGMGRRGIRDVL